MQKITRKQLEIFLSKYSTDKKILDVGSGGSSYGRYFPNRITVDIDPSRKPDIVASAEMLPFSDGEFDFVLCTEMLEHTENPFSVEKELRRVTSAGGMLLLTTRFVFPLHDTPNDYWRFTKYGLLKIFKDWELVEIVAETSNFLTIAALLQRMQFQTILRANKLSKLALLVLIKIFSNMNWLVLREYGDIGRKQSENQIMSTGYYLVCRKI